MDRFFESNPGFRSRIAHHIDFPDYEDDELVAIARTMADAADYRFSPEADKALVEYVTARRGQPNFANARSIRNALDRMRLRQSLRLFDAGGLADREALETLTEADVRASRVFSGGIDAPRADATA
jgi:hypothetical protein